MRICCKVGNSAPPPGIWRDILSHRLQQFRIEFSWSHQPLGACFLQLLQQIHICLLHIIPCRLSWILPWEIARPNCNLQLVSHRRGVFSHLPPVFWGVCLTAAFSYRLHNFNSIFTCELYALYRALLFLWCQPGQCHLICRLSNCLGVSVAIHMTTLLWMRFWLNCPTSRRYGSLSCSAGYLATLACSKVRPLMQQLKRLLCMET
jgi:hypothetical protein